MSIPATARSVIIKSKGVAAVETIPTPELRDDYILVKTTVVGINPTDWKNVYSDTPSVGARVGCDYAGVVLKVGSKVTRDFKPGDRIAGMCHSANASQHQDGAFGEYIIAKGDVQIKIPDNVTDEEAATLGVGYATVGQGLYQNLKLPLPGSPEAAAAAALPAEDRTPILIYGGSSAMGVYGVQLAKLSGLRVLTTCSPANFDLVRSLGADEVYDYNAPDWPEKVRESTRGRLRLVWDCISLPETAQACAAAMDRDAEGAEAAVYGALLYLDEGELSAVNPRLGPARTTLAYTIFGEGFVKYGRTWGVVPGDFEFARDWSEAFGALLAGGEVKTPTPYADRGGRGLEGVLVGLQELKDGKVRAGKLVYHV